MIIWGTKKVERKMGFVAEFCPICRAITPFKVIRIGMARHIYFISPSEGKLIGHVAECQICQSVKTVDPTKYASLEKREGVDVATLSQKTFPNIRETYSSRLNLEDQIKRQLKLDADTDRESLLLEPFQYLADQVEDRFAGSTQFDRESGIGCLGTVLLTGLLFTFSITKWKSMATQDQALIATGILILSGIIYTIIQLALEPRRFLRRKIIPKLVQALKPLNPSKQELVFCISKFKTAGFRIGKNVSAENLWEALNEQHNYHLK